MLDFSQSFFQLFDLPESFDLDLEVLADRYRDLQRVVHPDRYANASDQERRLAVQAASHINDAFQVLREPLSRARYLLSLHGMPVDSGSGGTSDPMFLMEQMELREALAEARNQPDPYRVVAQVVTRLSAQRDDLIRGFSAQFAEPSREHLEAARESVRKMQFLEKLCSEAENLEAELDEQL
jgi:molecular chaperone HscB